VIYDNPDEFRNHVRVRVVPCFLFVFIFTFFYVFMFSSGHPVRAELIMTLWETHPTDKAYLVGRRAAM